MSRTVLSHFDDSVIFVVFPTFRCLGGAAGLAPKVLSFRLPRSTDFSLYSAPGSTVFTFQPMSDINVSVKIGVLSTFEYKYPTGALPDYEPASIVVT